MPQAIPDITAHGIAFDAGTDENRGPGARLVEHQSRRFAFVVPCPRATVRPRATVIARFTGLPAIVHQRRVTFIAHFPWDVSGVGGRPSKSRVPIVFGTPIAQRSTAFFLHGFQA